MDYFEASGTRQAGASIAPLTFWYNMMLLLTHHQNDVDSHNLIQASPTMIEAARASRLRVNMTMMWSVRDSELVGLNADLATFPSELDTDEA